jgi:hypothetical protein
MVAATFPAGVGVLFEGERWVVLKTASEEFPALLLRLWWWSERSEKYVHRDTEVAAEDAFKILRRPDLPARSKFFRLGA